MRIMTILNRTATGLRAGQSCMGARHHTHRKCAFLVPSSWHCFSAAVRARGDQGRSVASQRRPIIQRRSNSSTRKGALSVDRRGRPPSIHPNRPYLGGQTRPLAPPSSLYYGRSLHAAWPLPTTLIDEREIADEAWAENRDTAALAYFRSTGDIDFVLYRGAVVRVRDE